jgi:hypothetical protein
MKSIFAVVCNKMPAVHNANFFASKEGAKIYLKALANERRHKMGVRSFEEDEGSFSFILGWEEHYISFSIIELPLLD